MRVCHVTTRFIRGGADENTAYSCNGQVLAGHDVHLIVGRDAEPGQLELLRPEVQVWRASKLVREVSPLVDTAGLFELWSLFRRIKPDIVHTHQSKAGIIGRLAAYLARVAIIIHGVHILPFVNISRIEAIVYRTLERLVAPLTDAYVDVGKEMRDECLSAGIGDPNRHVVIPSGMDLARFSVALRTKIRWPEVFDAQGIAVSNPRFVLLVSRLEERKGQLEFLSAFAEVAKEFPDVVLAIAGEGPDQGRIADRIRELGLSRRAILAGFRTDIERLMAVAEIGILTSRREGLPRVLIQYALMGLPIVAMDIPGAREIVTPGVNGFLAPPGDWTAMRESLSRLLREPETCRRIATAQGRLNFSSWSIEGMNTQLNLLYETLRQNKLNRTGLKPSN
jgi:glycosyltransferase involved in cell wall biosynthesis